MTPRAERPPRAEQISADERNRIHQIWQAKLDKNEWAGWCALVSGDMIEGHKVPVDPNTPFTGYYRSKRQDKTFAPVAYWKEDGKWVCLINGRQVEEDRAIEQWPFISRYPISLEWYTAVAEEGKPWPDADERVSSQALSVANQKPEAVVGDVEPRAVIGHNLPPEESQIDIIKNKIENAKGGVDNYKIIKDDETLAKAKSLKNRLTELAGEADKIRKAQKEPHLEAGRAVDEVWQPVVKDAQAAAKQINDAMDAYATEQLKLRRQVETEVERRRLAAEAIERENARKLDEAEAAGKPAPKLEVVPKVEPAPMPAADTTVRAGYGRAGSIKTKWVVTGITDVDLLFAFLKTHKELKEKMIELAQRAKDAGLEPPGVSLDEVAKVRG